MVLIEDLTIPRSFQPPNSAGPPVLLGFWDGSDQAFAACVYLRWELGDGNIEIKLPCAKARVVPLKK